MNEIFKDLTIIELASVLAGPSVGMFFAELGARVIKVENKATNGDVTRQWKLPAEDKSKETSAYYASVNWNKEVLMLDLEKENDLNHLMEIAKDADVIISNFKDGADVKLGVDYESFRKIKPSIIYGKITGFGEGEKRVAYDVVLQAETGFMFMNGTQESGPVKMPVALIDLLTAHQMKEALLVALIKKYKTGEGAKVTVSLFDSAIASLANQASNYLMEDFIPQRMGTRHPNIAPYGDLFTTADKKEVVLAIGSDQQFKSLCKILGIAEMAELPIYATNEGRVSHRNKVAIILKDQIKKWSSEELFEKLEEQNIPYGQVRNMKEVFELNAAKNMILENKDSKIVKSVAFYII